MTTLAQALLEVDMRSVKEPYTSVYEIVRSRLAGRGPDMSLPGISKMLSIDHPGRQPHPCEKFVIEGELGALSKEVLGTGGLGYETIYEIIQLPLDQFWVEWAMLFEDDGASARYGVLVDKHLMIDEAASKMPRDTATSLFGGWNVIVCASSRDKSLEPCPIFMARLAAIPRTRGTDGLPCAIVWSAWDDDRDQTLTGDNLREYFKMLGKDLAMALFLIGMPKVCEVRQVEHPVKLQKARVRNGKLPLLEYKRVTSRIGIGAVRYNGDRAEAGEHDVHRRRLHPVVAHWRVYREGREKPLAVRVPGHWRGDPELGVIVHERKFVR